jgi:hypothetical protein
VFAIHDTVVVFPLLPLLWLTDSHAGVLLDALQVPVQLAGDPVTVTSCEPDAAVGLADAGLSDQEVHVTSPDA